ncbi:fcrl5 [Pungitius sinensis]
MWLVKVLSVIYFTACAAQTSDGYTSTPIYDPPKPSLKLLSSWSDVFENETVVFHCDVHSPDWTVSWFVDGEKLETDLILKADGAYINITAYEGEYACRADLTSRGVRSGLSNTVSITVYDNAPTAMLTKFPHFNPMYVGETVNLICKVYLSSGWKYQWYKNGIELQTTKETNSIHLSFSDRGTYQCKAFRGETITTDISEGIKQDVLEIPVPTLNSTWSDVFPSESVELGCAMDGGADWVYTWYKHGHEVQADDVDSLGSNGATLSIRSASAKHKGEYTCKGKLNNRPVSSNFSPGLTLSVYDEKPSVTLTKDREYNVMFPGESVSFHCHIGVSSGWKYKWFKDGVPFNAPGNTYSLNTVGTANSGSYSCQAERGVDKLFFNSSSQAIRLEVKGSQPKPLLTQVPDVVKVYTGEFVSFKCKVELSSGWRYQWYKDGNHLPSNSDILTIDGAKPVNGGTYKCSATRDITMYNTSHSDGRTIQVSEIPVPSLKSAQPWLDVFPGESVKLSCGMAGGADWTFSWFKDKQLVQADSTTSFDSDAATLSISSASASHRGQYSCSGKLKSRPVVSSTFSHGLTLSVYGSQPKPLLTQVPDVVKVYTGESVSFKCKVELSSGWRYQWYKDGNHLLSNSDILTIDGTKLLNAGTYKCSATRDITMYNTSHSDGRTIQVSEIPVPSLKSVKPWLDVFPGESVKLSCGMAGDADWTFSWFKDKQLVQADSTTSFNVDAATLSISSASASHRGQYSCLGKLKSRPVVSSTFSHGLTLSVYGSQPKPLLTQVPDVVKVYTGESVSFKCKVELSSGWRYQWYKDGNHLLSNSDSLTINGTKPLNAGTYKCSATRDITMYNTSHSDGRTIQVSEIPVPSLKSAQPWLDVFPGESVKLSCGMAGGADWTFSWFKDKQLVQADSTTSFDSDAATLSISSASASHRGQYSCSGKLKSRPVVSSTFSHGLTLSVYDTKPRVTLMQNPIHNVMHTEDSVSFSCHINVSSGWKYLWLKDGKLLPESGNNHTIKSVETKTTGSYQCKTQRGSDAVFSSDPSPVVKLDVKERPQAGIALLTGWSEVFSTDSLVLRCEVHESPDMWNYTWFKAGQHIDLPPSEKHIVTPLNNPEQSEYTCRGISTGRPSYSRNSDSFQTKNLLLKRRVLLSISGCIFFGIIAVFLGCIFLRVFRKPADDKDKPGEAELFLTMSQLRKLDDTTCPMVQYITDAELNAPPKEADENGTICSETTQLPITSQDEQVVESEIEDVTEKNGGLISFK